MEKIRAILKRLCYLCTVSGQEKKCKAELFEIAGEYFDKAYEDSFGNFVFVKKSGKENAKKLLIDAHFDEVGFMVSEVRDGFLSVVPIGGIDTRVLGASGVVVHGEEPFEAIFTSTPPHLLDNDKAVPKMDSIYVDTLGSKISCKVGDVVSYAPHFTPLLNDRVSAKSLDDKACACAIFDMASRVDRDKLEYDLYVVISAQEETGKSGARLVTYEIEPDIAVVTDVFFARGEGIDDTESVEMGKGAYIDISSCTSISLTRKICDMLDKKGIACQVVCEPSRTYTNAEAVSITGRGVSTVLLGVAIDGMHSPSEIVSLMDIKSLSDILLEIAYGGVK